MKTATIKTPTVELLIIEPPNSWGLTIGEEALLIYDHTKKTFGKTHTFNGHYSLLGKPDEISEEDATALVEWGDADPSGDRFMIGYRSYFDGYKDDVPQFTSKTAKESLLSLLESEIYWVNPFEKPEYDEDYQEEWYECQYKSLLFEWHQAEQKIFDRNRTLIFKKNK